VICWRWNRSRGRAYISSRSKQILPGNSAASLKKLAVLRGKTIALAFFRDFHAHAHQFWDGGFALGADTMNLQAEASSLKKGESLLDTVHTLDAMKPDCLVMRHGASGAPEFVARHLEIPVINAGDGTHEHPSQGLLDALTIPRSQGHD